MAQDHPAESALTVALEFGHGAVGTPARFTGAVFADHCELNFTGQRPLQLLVGNGVISLPQLT